MKRIIIIMMFPMLANAEPGPVTRYLIDEPASLLDIGMVRLENLTTWIQGSVGFAWTTDGEREFFRADINSRYSPEDDKIYISISTMDGSATEAQMEDGCRTALGQTRIVILKSLPGLFQHIGYSDPSEPTALSSTLREMFELRCYFSGNDSAMGRFWASQSLDSKEMTIGQWKVSN